MTTELAQEPVYVDRNGYEMKTMPSMTSPIALISVNIFAAIANGVFVLISGGWPMVVSLILCLAAIFWIVYGWKKMIPWTLEQRAQYRKEKWEAWLRKEVPALVEQEPWEEIERAIGALIEEGNREPTYERAVDWLRTERQQLLQNEHAAQTRAIRQRKRAASCYHTHIEVVQADQAGPMAYICQECGTDVTPIHRQIEARNAASGGFTVESNKRPYPPIEADGTPIRETGLQRATRRARERQTAKEIAGLLRQGLITENEARQMLDWPESS